MNVPGASKSEDVDQQLRLEIGERIRAFRLKRGMSQAALGKLVPTSTGTTTTGSQISKWELGHDVPKRWKWPAIADALGASEEEVFGPAGARTDDVSRLDEIEDRLNALIRIQGLEETVERAARAERRSRRQREAEAADARRAKEMREPGRPRAVPTPPAADDDLDPEDVVEAAEPDQKEEPGGHAASG